MRYNVVKKCDHVDMDTVTATVSVCPILAPKPKKKYKPNAVLRAKAHVDRFG
jgi:hypothetical protein